MFGAQQKPAHADLPQALMVVAAVAFIGYPMYKSGELQKFLPAKPAAPTAMAQLQKTVEEKKEVETAKKPLFSFGKKATVADKKGPVSDSFLHDPTPLYTDTQHYAVSAAEPTAEVEPAQEQIQQPQPAQQVEEGPDSYYSDAAALRKTE